MKKLLFILILIFLFSFVFADDNDEIPIINSDVISIIKNEKTNISDSIRGKTIDVFFPTKILNCYIFVFKQNNVVYHIAANTEIENTVVDYEKLDLTNFRAIGYYSIYFSNNTKKNMFKNKEETSFDVLNTLDIINRYISIFDLEEMLQLNFELVDRGGFYSPFYEYLADINSDQKLFVMSSPSDDKKTSYFIGGWTIISKETRK